MKTDFVPVRPRVLADSALESELLTDALERLENEAQTTGTTYRVRLGGCGRKTALQFLNQSGDGLSASILSDSSVFQSVSKNVDISILPNCAADIELQLAAWETDELIEYMLANHAERCNEVMQHVLKDNLPLGGSPAVWQPILELMAKSQTAISPIEAALQLFDASSPNEKPKHTSNLLDAMISLGPAGFFHQRELVVKLSKLCAILLRINETRDEILARRIAERLRRRDRKALQAWMTGNLLSQIAKHVADEPRVKGFLTRCFRKNYLAGVVGSLLYRIDPDWRPADTEERLELLNGEFEQANWQRIRLIGHNFRFANLKFANIRDCLMIGCSLNSTRLHGAELDGARILRATALYGDFSQASLVDSKIGESEFRQTNFCNSNLQSAAVSESQFLGCDFTNATLAAAKFTQCRWYRCILMDTTFEDCIFDDCYLSNLDLSNKHMANVSFANSKLNSCDFENSSLDNIYFASTRLVNTLYTDSSAESCDFRRANLKGAGLAGINWTNCDLSGANLTKVAFHLGSSRSGIVNSPFPSHGTRTGFYTDDIEDVDCKPPEAIRKAALLDCDLRGANLDGVDFYLVDLRGSRFDEKYRKHLMGCGAILK